ncbi:Neuropeptide F receptor [Holothuria leucospilota]|uniref:Neuropeptide F receptor n=1 Tax=Holothuria leucospilota TaxID=206669 RepID=A0A9Q1BHW3_HOLLE|nr:Neuropeptide F receptor [Holothuria leucospilota]
MEDLTTQVDTIFEFTTMSGNTTLPECNLIWFHPLVKTLLIGIVALLAILGIFGNVLVIIVVARRPKMRTVINWFITNLSLTDLLYCTVGIPVTVTSLFAKNWPLGLVFCGVAQMITSCLVLVSSLTLTAIAVDRFCLVVYPFLKPVNRNRCFAIIIVIWIFCVGLTLPMSIYAKVEDITEIVQYERIVCIGGMNETVSIKYFTAIFTIQFCYPMILVTIAHVSIAWKLKRNVKPGVRRKDTEQRENTRRQRMNRMLSAVVIVFASCWLPLNLYDMFYDYRIINPTEICVVPFIIFLPSVCSTFLNPLLYAWLNDNFRKEFYKLLPFLTILGEASYKSSAGPTGSHASGAFSNLKRPRTTLGSYLQPTTAESTVLKTTPRPQRKGVEDTKI